MRISEMMRSARKVVSADDNAQVIKDIKQDLLSETKSEQAALVKSLKAIHKAEKDLFHQYTDNLDPKDKSAIGDVLFRGDAVTEILLAPIKRFYPRAKLHLK